MSDDMTTSDQNCSKVVGKYNFDKVCREDDQKDWETWWNLNQIISNELSI